MEEGDLGAATVWRGTTSGQRASQIIPDLAGLPPSQSSPASTPLEPKPTEARGQEPAVVAPGPAGGEGWREAPWPGPHRLGSQGGAPAPQHALSKEERF